MKFKTGDVITPVPQRNWVEIYDASKSEDTTSVVGCLEKGEIAIVIDPGDSSSLQVTILSQRGMVGRVVSAWLKVLFRSS